MAGEQSAVAVARDRIVTVCRAATPQPWRVHYYPPDQVASPCVFVDYPTLAREQPFIVGAFPVVILIDGTDQAQAAAFDLALARMWDAIDADPELRVDAAAPYVRDIGGPSSRLYVLTLEADLTADTLCLHPMYAETAAL